jgi:hypothetical protein
MRLPACLLYFSRVWPQAVRIDVVRGHFRLAVARRVSVHAGAVSPALKSKEVCGDYRSGGGGEYVKCGKGGGPGFPKGFSSMPV